MSNPQQAARAVGEPNKSRSGALEALHCVSICLDEALFSRAQSSLAHQASGGSSEDLCANRCLMQEPANPLACQCLPERAAPNAYVGVKTAAIRRALSRRFNPILAYPNTLFKHDFGRTNKVLQR